jgi:hypothetical protein
LVAACVATGMNVGSIVTPSNRAGLSIGRRAEGVCSLTSKSHARNACFGRRTSGNDLELHRNILEKTMGQAVRREKFGEVDGHKFGGMKVRT